MGLDRTEEHPMHINIQELRERLAPAYTIEGFRKLFGEGPMEVNRENLLKLLSYMSAGWFILNFVPDADERGVSRRSRKIRKWSERARDRIYDETEGKWADLILECVKASKKLSP